MRGLLSAENRSTPTPPHPNPIPEGEGAKVHPTFMFARKDSNSARCLLSCSVSDSISV